MKSLCAAVLALLAGAALASEAPADPYGLRPGITRADGGAFVVSVEIRSPEGERLFTRSVAMAAGSRKVTTPYGEVSLNVNADGRGLAALQVSRPGTRIVELIELQPPAGYLRVKKETRVIRRVNPHYPGEARDRGITGVAIVDARVNASGAVDSVQVLLDPGSGLGDAAADAVRQWRFEPAVVDGKPVAVVFQVVVAFKLR